MTLNECSGFIDVLFPLVPKSDCKTMWSFQEDLIEINNSHLGCETHIQNHWLRKLDCNWIFSEMEPLWQPAPVSAVATFVLTYLPMVLLTESVVHVTFEKHFLCLFLFVSLSLSGRFLCWRIIRWSRRCGGSGGGFSAAGEQRASLKHFQHCGNHLLLLYMSRFVIAINQHSLMPTRSVY